MLRVALFVEGSPESPSRRGASLPKIWGETLCRQLGLRELEPIIPISKKHLVALDPSNPPMSGASEPLDLLITRMLRREPGFDAAIVAWDLIPAWNPESRFCRWEETLDLYRFLAASKALPPQWIECAQRRFHELEHRQHPGARQKPPRIEAGMVLAVCMEPMFEAALTQSEGGILTALQIRQRPPGWPSHGWANPQERQPDSRILAPAINVARDHKTKPARQVGGDMRTNKHGWGDYLLRSLLKKPSTRKIVLDYPFLRRLVEVAKPE